MHIFRKKRTVFLIFGTLLTAIISVAFSRYYSTFHKTIILKVREPKYSVIFNANTGTGNMNEQKFVYGSSQKLNANLFTKEGYLFNYWETDVHVRVDSIPKGSTGDIDLYAVWTSGYTLTLSYDTARGTITGAGTYAKNEKLSN